MHTEPNSKDRMVTDEHPGYDARAHWCGEDRYAPTTNPAWLNAALEWNHPRGGDPEPVAPRPNLRRVRAWAEWAGATWRIVKWLAVFALGVLVGAYAESAVWR